MSGKKTYTCLKVNFGWHIDCVCFSLSLSLLWSDWKIFWIILDMYRNESTANVDYTHKIKEKKGTTNTSMDSVSSYKNHAIYDMFSFFVRIDYNILVVIIFETKRYTYIPKYTLKKENHEISAIFYHDSEHFFFSLKWHFQFHRHLLRLLKMSSTSQWRRGKKATFVTDYDYYPEPIANTQHT